MPDALERLVVWQKATDLAGIIYEVTQGFPDRERFGLTSQLQRSGTSVAANIAEGYGRVGTRDFVRFLGIARGSAYEVFTHLTVARKAGFTVDDAAFDSVNEVLRILTGMINRLGRDQVKEEQAVYRAEYSLEDEDLV